MAAQRKRDLFIPTQSQTTATETKTEVLEQNSNSFGLQIQEKKVHVEHVTETIVQEEVTEQVKKTLEESAIEAIIKGKRRIFFFFFLERIYSKIYLESRGEDEENDDGPVKVIPANETLSFRDDVENRPDEMTVDDYESMPVDEFGAALLRGLGWNEGEGIGKNRKHAA